MTEIKQGKNWYYIEYELRISTEGADNHYNQVDTYARRKRGLLARHRLDAEQQFERWKRQHAQQLTNGLYRNPRLVDPNGSFL